MAGYAELLTRVGKAAGRPWAADHRLATVVALEALETVEAVERQPAQGPR